MSSTLRREAGSAGSRVRGVGPRLCPLSASLPPYLPAGSGDALQLAAHTSSHLEFHVLAEGADQRQQLLLYSETHTGSSAGE